MAYNVEYEDRKDYLYAHITGNESHQNAITFFHNLKEKMEKENWDAVLIVDEVKGILNTNETYELSREIAELHRGRIIAFVDPKEETFSQNYFGGTVVANRGVVTQVFKTEEAAIKWLGEILNKNKRR